MTDNSNTYIGHVTRFDNERHFGFIETENEKSYFFFFDKTEQIQLKKQGLVNKIHKFHSGDEVEFKIRPSQKDAIKFEAFDLKFIKNERRENLVTEAIQTDTLLGYLKLIDNEKFFVKHKSTYVFIPLDISEWETDLDEIYYNRIDKLVNFRLTQTQKLDKLKAVLTDAKTRSSGFAIPKPYRRICNPQIQTTICSGLQIPNSDSSKDSHPLTFHHFPFSFPASKA